MRTASRSCGGETTVCECTEIREPGPYRLTDDIVECTRDYCITILASDIVPDAKGTASTASIGTITGRFSTLNALSRIPGHRYKGS